MDRPNAPPPSLRLDRIAHHRIEPADGEPRLMFLPGFRSTMEGEKARAVAELAERRGWGCVRFDYSGHGASRGDFGELGIADWRDDAIAVLDALTRGRVILIGSSMGGWLMVLIALARPDRIAGMIGINAAPDFTREIERSGGEALARAREAGEPWFAPSRWGDPHPIGRTLLEQGERCAILDGPIATEAPATLLAGTADLDVPYARSIELAARLAGPATVELIDGADHRASRPEDLRRLRAAIERIARETR